MQAPMKVFAGWLGEHGPAMTQARVRFDAALAASNNKT
jgi:hypothetical protein